MCIPASMIVTKDKVYWSKKSESHTDIIEEFGLRERNVRGEYLLVPIEIVPPDYNYLLPLDEWEYSIDIGECERDCLPAWYDRKKVENRARMALRDWYKQKVIQPNKTRKIKDKQVFCYGKVIARGWSEVTAYGSSVVEAYEHSTVNAFGNSVVRARDNAMVRAFRNSVVICRENSKVGAWDDSMVYAFGENKVTAYVRSTVINYGNVKTKLMGSKKAVLIDRSKK